MKMLRTLALSILALLQIGGFVNAQEREAPAKPAALALEVTYLKGTPPTFQTVYAAMPGGKPPGTWYGRFGRLRASRPGNGSPPVRAVNIVPQFEGDAVRANVSVYVGAQFFDKELPVASYLLREGERITVEALTSFGVEPFEIALVKLRLSAPTAPPVVNNTTSIEVISVEPIQSTRPSYTLHLRNLSNKNVAAIRIDVFAGGKQRLSSMPQGEQGQPLIKPGAVYERRTIAAEDVVMKQQGYRPKFPAGQSFVIRSVVFDDGTFEGESEPAANFAALQAGSKLQLARVVTLLQRALDSSDLGASETIAMLTRDVAALSVDPPSSARDELSTRFPGLDQTERLNLGNSIRFSLQNVRKLVLDDIEMFEKTLRQSASQTDYRSWLAATTEKYRRWLSRL